MKDMERQIKSIVASIRKRLVLARVIQYLVYGISIALLVGALLFIAALITPIPFLIRWQIIGATVAVLGAVIVGFINLPTTMESAKLVDSYGLKERTITAIELLGEDNDNPYKQMVVEDAAKHLGSLDKKNIVSYKPSNKSLYTVLAMCVLLFISGCIPSYNKDIAKEKEELAKTKQKIEKKLEQVKKEIEEDNQLSKADKEKLSKLFNKSQKDTLKADSSKEMEKKAEATKDLVKLKKDQLKSQQMQDMAKKLMEKTKLNDLAKAMDSKDSSQVNKALEQLMDKLNGMSEEELQKLIESLPEPLNNMSQEELQQALSQLANNMQNQMAQSNSGEQCTLDHDHSQGT